MRNGLHNAKDEFIMKKEKAAKILNIIIIILTLIGLFVMLYNNSDQGVFWAQGFANLKYYTVLSNLFCGLVAVIYGVVSLLSKDNLKSSLMRRLKLMAAACVGLTFIQIAGFFGPLYGYSELYKGSNLYFHLIIPILAMVEFVIIDFGKIPFIDTIISAIPTFIYGFVYLVNILINGIGEWPDGNDWYGFMNWGLGVGLVIYAGIVLASFAMACALRGLNRLAGRSKL